MEGEGDEDEGKAWNILRGLGDIWYTRLGLRNTATTIPLLS